MSRLQSQLISNQSQITNEVLHQLSISKLAVQPLETYFVLYFPLSIVYVVDRMQTSVFDSDSLRVQKTWFF